MKTSAVIGGGAALAAGRPPYMPLILTGRKAPSVAKSGRIIFRPYLVQSGLGPHLLDWAFTTDSRWDAFPSNIAVTDEGVIISDGGTTRKFGINVRWNVEGFGYTYLTADNGGEFYRLPGRGKTAEFNLNYELANSRVIRNRNRRARFLEDSWLPGPEVEAFLELSEGYREDAARVLSDGEKCGRLAQKSLYYALWGSEMLELDHARFMIAKSGHRSCFFLGCDARAFYQMYQDIFWERFTQLFNYATITYVWKGDGIINDFEPREGQKQFAIRDVLFRELKNRGITVEGRPLFWFHTWVTPDWIKQKSYDELLTYVEKHTRDMISHYGGGMYAWEIVNELHDWANEVGLTPDQTVELTRLACDVAKDTAPNVHRLVNNCCPFAEYVSVGRWSGQEAKYPQRTPWQFTRDLVEAGVDFTVIGLQMYFPYRDLQDIIMLMERYETFKKPVQLSEVGASSGPSDRSVRLGTVGFPEEAYPWHRPWDESIQAEWLESVYTLAYSQPYVEGVNWFDFVDPHSFIANGGLLRSPQGERKEAFFRQASLRETWDISSGP